MSQNRVKFANFRVSPREKRQLEILARLERRTVSGLIRHILSEWFSNRGHYFKDKSPNLNFGEYQQYERE